MNKKSTRALASATVVGLVLATVATGNVQAAPGKVDRLGGSNRYQTAANVATKNWEKSDNVILVSGEGYADALSASLLAQKLDAPVLLTGKDGLDGDTNKAIDKLGAKNVYILGSEGVVSKNVQTSLEKSGKTVKRLAGNNRFQTNVAIANELVKNHGVKADDVLVVNGNKYLADALTAAPVAAKEGKILLLVGEDLSTAKEAKEFIKNNGVKNVTVIGRDVTVSDAMYKDLGATKRVSGGKDRFETNRLVLQAFGLKGSHLYVANGQDDHLVDSLVASAIAGKFNSPVVLVSNNKDIDDKAVEYIKENANEKTDLNVVGSEAILSNDLVEEINNSVNPQLVAAEKAVKAYEDAKITNLEEIKAAKTLGADAVKAVEAVKDATKKEAFQARIAAKDKLVKEAEAKLAFKVESVTAINETAIQIKGLAKEVKEADLVGKKITLKAGDVELTATYVATSLTEDGKANFVLGAEKKLTDAATYTVSADWATFTTDTFMAKGLVAPYVNKVEVLTKGVPANTAASNLNLVHFTAKNQYGEDIALVGNVGNLAVKGTINGVPFVTNELADQTNFANGIVEINKDLKEGDKVALTFTNTINGKANVEVGTVSYTVVKAETAVPTTISDMKAVYANAANPNEHNNGTEAKEVLPDDHVTLSATVKNQFGSPIAGESVRWVVEEGKDLVTKTDDSAIDEISDAQNFTFKAIKAGKLKISAFLGNGQKVTYEVMVGAKALNVLNLADEAGTRFNQDENIVKVVTPNQGANLTADMIKFDVKATKTSVDVTSADVRVTAKVRGGDNDANKNDIVIVAKSTKPGKYTITPYVGESLEKATAKVAGFDVTTTIDQTVTSIDDIKFDALELKTGKEIKKDITFRNKHNEVVVLENAAAGLNIVSTPVINGAGEIATVTKDADNNKNVLTLKVNTAKSYNLVIQKGDVIKSFNLTFSAPTFTKIDAGTDITGVVAGDSNTKAKYQSVKFLDQDNKEMPVKKSDLKVSATKPDGSALADGDLEKLITLAKTYSVNDKGVVTFEKAEAGDNVVAYKINPTDEIDQGVYTVKIANKNADENLDGKIYDTFTVTVGAKREAKTIEITPASTNVALNGKVKVKVTPKDQYGEFKAVGAENIAVNAGDNFTAGAVTEINKDGGAVDGTHPVAAYEVTLTGKTKGTNDVIFTIADANAFGNGDLVVKKSMTVDAVANLVASVAVDKTDIKPLYSTENAGTQVQLKAIAKDANGVVIPVDNADLSWTIKSVTGKVGAVGAEADATVATVGTVGLHTGLYEAAQNFKGTVTIEVKTANMKVGEVTLNLDNAPAAAKTGTTAVVNNTPDRVVDGDKTKEGIQVLLDGVGDKEGAEDAEANGAIVLKLDAKDQYGADFDTAVTKVNTIVMADDSSVVTPKIDDATHTITLTAKSVGTSNVYVQYNGDTIKLEVSVNKDAVDKAVAAMPVGVALDATQETHKGAAAKPEVVAVKQVVELKVTGKPTTNGSIKIDNEDVAVLDSDADAAAVATKIKDHVFTNWDVELKAGETDTVVFTAKTGAEDVVLSTSMESTGITALATKTTTNGKAHVAAEAEVKEVGTTTVTAGAAKDATIKVKVADGAGLDKTVDVAVKGGDTAVVVAGKIQAALAADTDVNGKYAVTVNGADVVLTQTGAGADVALAVTIQQP
ncbi:cell wall-binding repeat-containing protein [Clostridium sporogenes]|uniref:cell wall-binding repeat-containing protein n=1 Tax=Clostridium sporogenes TaxID=1509 RepID=UPI001C11E7C3|nr:cell wall-binding repeat-containing protein [Clostridium sporogenes]MBU5301145.1 cell wall-binding repeat-containing protein [Clostridium sporogenes]